jgi:hypothetical protein
MQVHQPAHQHSYFCMDAATRPLQKIMPAHEGERAWGDQ